MGTLMLAGAIAVWTCLGQANQGNVASSDLEPPAGIAQQTKAAPKPAAKTPTQPQARAKEKRVNPATGTTSSQPAPAPAPTAPPSSHEPPVAQPTAAPEAPLPAITNTATAGKKGRSIAAFWMTAPVE